MITAKRVDIRYATALLNIAKERDVDERVYEDMLALRVLTNESADFKAFLRSPAIKTSQKAQTLNVLFKDVFHSLTMDFLQLILKKTRVENILCIATAYIRMYRVENHIKTVTVYTGQDLHDPQKLELELALSRQMPGETIDLNSRVFPDIIGGFILRYDDYFYDASIRSQLRLLHRNFEQNLHESQI